MSARASADLGRLVVTDADAVEQVAGTRTPTAPGHDGQSSPVVHRQLTARDELLDNRMPIRLRCTRIRPGHRFHGGMTRAQDSSPYRPLDGVCVTEAERSGRPGLHPHFPDNLDGPLGPPGQRGAPARGRLIREHHRDRDADGCGSAPEDHQGEGGEELRHPERLALSRPAHRCTEPRRVIEIATKAAIAGISMDLSAGKQKRCQPTLPVPPRCTGHPTARSGCGQDE